ncbi:hypothetical protein CASFOL_022853 [Castilleja foliolosa]|uniref:Uncharacterized protein n=1 Tax=Castilleja foliolosa TaxID=1961234 RepID=A0ABD3CWZ3_9LAMI
MSDRVMVHGCKRARGGGDNERERNMVVVHGGDWLRFGLRRCWVPCGLRRRNREKYGGGGPTAFTTTMML